jgi:putative RNA 2'-phosphotransferase
MMSVDPTEISRLSSHALRHAPEEYGLQLDSEGWVPLDNLLSAMHARGGDWEGVTRSDIESMIASSSKQRHELNGDRIRAMYGHSVSTAIAHAPSTPPVILFHGTSPAAWALIETEGLKPMRRQHVHLSAEMDTAMLVGRRKANPPVLLAIRAQEAEVAGATFSLANGTVWLADRVPSAFIDVRMTSHD